jgi:hypothetical protein
MNEAILVTPSLEKAILTPVEARSADWIAINDELGGMVLDELGLPLCED